MNSKEMYMDNKKSRLLGSVFLSLLLIGSWACGAPPEPAVEAAAPEAAAESNSDFKDDFESGGTEKWSDDQPVDSAVAVEDDFESGDTSQWQDKTEPGS